MARMNNPTRKRARARRLMLAHRSSQGGRGSMANRHIPGKRGSTKVASTRFALWPPASAIGYDPAGGVTRSAAAGLLVHAFGTELWTLKRVQVLIARMRGVTFSKAHVWWLLGALGFSSQKPERRPSSATRKRC